MANPDLLSPDRGRSFQEGGPPLRVVLVNPEIPPNTGTIGRLCLGTGCELHLVKPLGFDISEKAVRRAGLDYWKHVQLFVHEDLDAFWVHSKGQKDAQFVCLSARRGIPYPSIEYPRGVYLMLGQESKGLPHSVLDNPPGPIVNIPHLTKIRSLNLANAATVVVYEALKQLHPVEFGLK